jgi:hypothetical protein
VTSHRHRHHHRHEREGQELYTHNRSTTSPSIKASSPSNTRHLRRQVPQAHQEKLPELNYENSTSYFESLDALYYASLKAQGEIKKAKSTLDDLYIGALKAHEELKKDKSPRPRAHLATTTLQDGAPKFDFTATTPCGIDNAESTTTLFQDGAATATTTETIKDQALEASDTMTSEDDASIFGGESEMTAHGIFPSVMEASDDVPSSAFIHGDGDEMVEHGIFPSTTATYDEELSDLSHHMENESVFTTSPIYDEMPQFPCEESHPIVGEHDHLWGRVTPLWFGGG